MHDLLKYFEHIGADFIEQKTELTEKEVPKVMQKFYENIKEVDLPFGRIYAIDLALHQFTTFKSGILVAESAFLGH